MAAGINIPVLSVVQNNLGKYGAYTIQGSGMGGQVPTVFDFSLAQYADAFKFINGFWCDNSGSNADLIITVRGTPQSFRVFAGQVATFPIIAGPYPYVIVTPDLSNTAYFQGTTDLMFTTYAQSYSSPLQKGLPTTDQANEDILSPVTYRLACGAAPASLFNEAFLVPSNVLLLSNSGANSISWLFGSWGAGGGNQLLNATYGFTLAPGATFSVPAQPPGNVCQIWAASFTGGSTLVAQGW